MPAFTQDEMQERIGRAVVKFIGVDRALIRLEANERTLTHKLAEYLQQEFPPWNVDCEYNRLGGDRKEIDLPEKYSTIDDEDLYATTVYPDIIIHKREQPYENNLLVIEAKKQGNPRKDQEWDIVKLHHYKKTLRY